MKHFTINVVLHFLQTEPDADFDSVDVDAVVDVLMTALVEMGVPDPAVSADRGERRIDVEVGVFADDEPEAFTRGREAILAALATLSRSGLVAAVNDPLSEGDLAPSREWVIRADLAPA
jgi:hypothetical protein